MTKIGKNISFSFVGKKIRRTVSRRRLSWEIWWLFKACDDEYFLSHYLLYPSVGSSLVNAITLWHFHITRTGPASGWICGSPPLSDCRRRTMLTNLRRMLKIHSLVQTSQDHNLESRWSTLERIWLLGLDCEVVGWNIAIVRTPSPLPTPEVSRSLTQPNNTLCRLGVYPYESSNRLDVGEKGQWDLAGRPELIMSQSRVMLIWILGFQRHWEQMRSFRGSTSTVK